jgi:hypothetical protein
MGLSLLVKCVRQQAKERVEFAFDSIDFGQNLFSVGFLDFCHV